MLMNNRRVLTLVAGLAALALSACSGVGDGNSLQSLVIVSSANTAVSFDDLEAGGDTEAQAYQCLAGGLTLYGLFNKNDSAGNFTDRATWSSADPAIVKVSNGEIPIPGQDGLVYSTGTILPVAAGSTVVTAKYLDLSADITVNVGAPSDIKIEPENPRLGINTRQGFQLTAVINGVKQDITTYANPTVAFAPVNDALATVTYSSSIIPVVTALTAADPLTLNFSLPVCNQTLSTTVRVAPIQGLVINHEPGFSGNLVVKTNERLSAFADFGDGPEQDVTSASTYTVSGDATVGNRIVSLVNYVSAVAAGEPATVTATCCALDRNNDGDILDADEAATVTSGNSPSFTPVAGTLTAFTIAPTNASVEQYTDQQFTATGTFDSGATQDITRFVVWTQTDPATSAASSLLALGYGNTSSTAGLAVAVRSPFVDNRITAPTPLTISADLVDSVQPSAADLAPVTTTLTLTPPPGP